MNPVVKVLLKYVFASLFLFVRWYYFTRFCGSLPQLRNVTGETAGVFLEYIQRNLPEAVSMSVEQTSLQGMPDYLQPPPEALAFLRSQETEVA